MIDWQGFAAVRATGIIPVGRRWPKHHLALHCEPAECEARHSWRCKSLHAAHSAVVQYALARLSGINAKWDQC